MFMKMFYGPMSAALMVATLGTLGGCGAINLGPRYDSDGYRILGDLAGKKLTAGNVAKLVRDAGFSEEVVGKMVCTAEHESRFYTEARGVNNNHSIDIGLFQINSINWKWCTGKTGDEAEELLKDPVTNTKCAYVVAEGAKAPKLNRWYGYLGNKEACDQYVAPESEDLSF